MKGRCCCPNRRPVTIATFRDAELVSLVSHHVGGCPLADRPLDRVNWTPRPPGPDPNPDQLEPPTPRPQRPQRPPESAKAPARRRTRTEAHSPMRR